MKKALMLRIQECIEYNPDTGFLTWKKSPDEVKKIGDIAGYTPSHTYARVRIDGKMFFSHKVAWFLYYGKYPKEYIRHIDGNKANNKINNLSIGRKSTRKEIDVSVPLFVQYVRNSDKWKLFYKKNGRKVTVKYYTSKGAAMKAQKKRVFVK